MAMFIDHCINGNIDDIKKMSLKNCDLDKGFRLACRYGHYDIVKYLVILYKTGNSNYNMINIHFDRDSGFRSACDNGQYDIVKYLVELYKNDKTGNPNYDMTNIHSWRESGFRFAHMNGHHNIVKYLMTLYKKHKYKPFNNYLIIFKKIEKYNY